MGPNGSGKTTLARIATLWLHPSEGEVTVLGGTLGRADVRSLRRRVAFVSAAMAEMVRPQLTAAEVVVCARFAALELGRDAGQGGERGQHVDRRGERLEVAVGRDVAGPARQEGNANAAFPGLRLVPA